MTFNLIFMAVGTGKFAEEFLHVPRWIASLVVFGVVGVYVTLGGIFGVILTDLFQTALIAIGAVILTIMAFGQPAAADIAATHDQVWSSLVPAWTLWSGYAESTPEVYRHFQAFGPILLAGFAWLVCRILGGPNVWDFQFFLTTRSPREASLAAGMWTVGYTLRWIIACAFLILGIQYLGSDVAADAEKIMPRVVLKMPVGLQGAFLAILLAALMSTLSAMITVTSSVITNDFLRRYFTRGASEKRLVRLGQLASIVTILLALVFSLAFEHVISAWETMIFFVVTVINAPATMRWHWWRFSAKAFVWSMVTSAAMLLLRRLFFPDWALPTALAVDALAALGLTIVIGWSFRPADMDVLVSFYSRVRPFGLWKPVRLEAERRGLVPPRDPMPRIDVLNGGITVVFQLALAIVPFCIFLRQWSSVACWSGILVVFGAILYFTWYRNLPSPEEK